MSEADDDGAFAGRVELVVDARALLLRAPDGARHIRFAQAHDLSPGDLALVRRDGDHWSLLGEVRPRAAHPLQNDDVRRLGRSEVARALRHRSEAKRVTRAWFERARFTEVETPSVVPNPGMDLHLAAPGVIDLDAPSALPQRASRWLITSPEYHLKRALAAGYPRVFELARCFRAGERGARHQPEFTMLEWYRAWATLDDVLRDTEAIVREVCVALHGEPVARRGGREVPLVAPFETMSVREAFARHCPEVRDPIALAYDDEERYFELLSDRIEPALGWDAPVFLTRYPACHASLARLCPEDPRVSLRAELYLAGLELCNAFDELIDPVEQRARFVAEQSLRAARGLPVYPLDEAFLAALEAGIPPSAGNALGFDRLLMLALGSERIDDVVAFPG